MFQEEMHKLGKAEKVASFKIPADIIVEVFLYYA